MNKRIFYGNRIYVLYTKRLGIKAFDRTSHLSYIIFKNGSVTTNFLNESIAKCQDVLNMSLTKKEKYI